MTDLMLRNNPTLNTLPMFKHLDRWLGSPLFTSPFSVADSLLGTSVGPAVNIYETKDEYVVEAELPGWKRDDIDISFENNVLTISGNRQVPDDDGRQYLRFEGLAGQFTRSFTLSGVVDTSHVDAAMADGVLTIHLPKREEAKPRRIEIKTVQ
ncbi:MAG: Hsp20/alpha crystallin family protein [Pyrinomonadaceae bacterium]